VAELNQDSQQNPGGPSTQPSPQGFYTTSEIELSRRLWKAEKGMVRLTAEQATFVAKSDLAEALKTVVSEIKAESKAEISGLETRLKGDVSELETRLKGDVSDLKADMRSRFTHHTALYGIACTIFAGALVALFVKFWP
jgi:hypothetical protein